MNKNIIFEKGVKAPHEIFSNTVWFNMLLTDEEQVFDTQVYDVIFEPSARTHWDEHKSTPETCKMVCPSN